MGGRREELSICRTLWTVRVLTFQVRMVEGVDGKRRRFNLIRLRFHLCRDHLSCEMFVGIMMC